MKLRCRFIRIHPVEFENKLPSESWREAKRLTRDGGREVSNARSFSLPIHARFDPLSLSCSVGGITLGFHCSSVSWGGKPHTRLLILHEVTLNRHLLPGVFCGFQKHYIARLCCIGYASQDATFHRGAKIFTHQFEFSHQH